jgi:hypothetical protein
MCGADTLAKKNPPANKTQSPKAEQGKKERFTR